MNAKIDPKGWKYMNLYYSGHGEGDGVANTGNWVFKDDVITLQDVIDEMDGKHETILKIYSNCSYSGSWAKALEEHRE